MAASYPDDLKYHPEHDWARIEGDEATFGITWYAQDALGEVVFFDPPEVGTQITKDQVYAEVESVKAVSDVFAPLSGEIVAVNEGLADSPEKINDDPYGEGWLVRVQALRSVRARLAARRERLPRPASVRGLMSRYTSVTDQDLQAMLAAIGVGSLEDLFADIPEGLRLDRPLDLPAGVSEQEVFDELSGLAARNRHADAEVELPRGRDVRPLRAVARRRADLPLRVPDAVHALPARDLAGRPPGDVRVPDRDLGADRPAGVERLGVRGPERRGGRGVHGQARDPPHPPRGQPRRCIRSRAPR